MMTVTVVEDGGMFFTYNIFDVVLSEINNLKDKSMN